MNRRIAWFGGLDLFHHCLEELPWWQEGLNTLLPESSVTHTSGFQTSAELEALNPLADWWRRLGLADHRQALGFGEGVFPCVPGILARAENGHLRAGLEAAHRQGLEFGNISACGAMGHKSSRN